MMAWATRTPSWLWAKADKAVDAIRASQDERDRRTAEFIRSLDSPEVGELLLWAERWNAHKAAGGEAPAFPAVPLPPEAADEIKSCLCVAMAKAIVDTSAASSDDGDDIDF